MNISKWAFEGTPNYPVKVTKGEDGMFRVTTSAIKGKEWAGESTEDAMRAFNLDMQKEYDRLMFENQPNWMKEVEKGEW